MLLLRVLQLSLLLHQPLFLPLDLRKLHCIRFVLAGLEAEQKCVLTEGLAQARIVRQTPVGRLDLSEAVEVRPHLLKRGSQDALIRCVSSLLGLVALVLGLVRCVVQDLCFERGFHNPEQLVLLLFKAILALL